MSVTRAAIAERSDRVRVTCANSGWPLSFSMTAMPRRDTLARCQTPQGFRLSVIRHAYQLARADPGFSSRPATDDCGIVLRYLPEVAIHIVTGSERNLKITYPGDLVVAEALLRGGA